MAPIVAENVREHALALEGIWQVDDDAVPLFGENLIIFGIIATRVDCCLTEIDEGGLHRFRVATIRELSIEDRRILVNLQCMRFEHDVVLL